VMLRHPDAVPCRPQRTRRNRVPPHSCFPHHVPLTTGLPGSRDPVGGCLLPYRWKARLARRPAATAGAVLAFVSADRPSGCGSVHLIDPCLTS